MFNLTNIPVHVNDVIFGELSEITEDAPARDAAGRRCASAGTSPGPSCPARVLWWRYRRLTP